ncbi:uncharacterized protein [Numenius arquata]|uniref:uncharacterized protein n=1 Tax=Numenius arquata TaxID=31919 RepID=UPI003D30B128
MNEFDIDENTGQIFTVSVAGKSGTFYLEVQAADQGTRRLTAQTTVNVTVDSSSSNNMVVAVLNQKINVVEKNIAEVKRVLEDKLAWNVYIVDVYSDESERKARSSTDVTYVKIIAFDEANQEVSAENVKRKLREQKSNIEEELEKIFSTPVTAAIEEAPAESAAPELIATIVLGVLLACTLIASLAYVLFTVRRKRKHEQQHLIKQAETVEGIDNLYATYENGSLSSLKKLEHTNNVKMETIAFSNPEDADKDNLQANERCNYLETLDRNSEHEENARSEKATEPRNADAQPSAELTKQDGFLTDTNEGATLSLPPGPTTQAPEKEIKGVKFSEVAIILDVESEDEEPDDDEVF